METIIYIDESGNSGQKTNSKYASTDLISYYALILSPEARKDALMQMPECLSLLKKEFNAEEFHFTDIYSGRNEFNGIELSKRLQIFWMFADVFRNMQYPILMQSFSPEDYARNHFTNLENEYQDGFNLKNHKDFALYHLFLRINSEVKKNKNKYSLPFEIVIDEGRRNNGSEQECGLFGDMLKNRSVSYRSSKEEPLLQLVDFVAFSLNKWKWITQNNKTNFIDKEFLDICTYADFNTVNMVKRRINTDADIAKLYDKEIDTAFSNHSDLPGITLKQHKENTQHKTI